MRVRFTAQSCSHFRASITGALKYLWRVGDRSWCFITETNNNEYMKKKAVCLGSMEWIVDIKNCILLSFNDFFCNKNGSFQYFETHFYLLNTPINLTWCCWTVLIGFMWRNRMLSCRFYGIRCVGCRIRWRIRFRFAKILHVNNKIIHFSNV